jgi:small multidrug resistance pump
MGWLLLAGAIASEITATLALRTLSAGFRAVPALVTGVGYVVSFALLAFALRSITVSAAYAVWSGVGTAGIAVLAALLYGERITVPAAAGIALIIAGVVLVNLGGAAHR